MPQYQYRVRNKARRVLAENAIVERDIGSACRSISTAIALFVGSRGGEEGAVIELDDPDGTTVVRLSLSGEEAARSH